MNPGLLDVHGNAGVILDLVLAIKAPNLDKLAKLCSLKLVALHLLTVKG